MIESPYQIVKELRCDELYFLKDRKHLKGKKIKREIERKCGFYN